MKDYIKQLLAANQGVEELFTFMQNWKNDPAMKNNILEIAPMFIPTGKHSEEVIAMLVAILDDPDLCEPAKIQILQITENEIGRQGVQQYLQKHVKDTDKINTHLALLEVVATKGLGFAEGNELLNYVITNKKTAYYPQCERICIAFLKAGAAADIFITLAKEISPPSLALFTHLFALNKGHEAALSVALAGMNNKDDTVRNTSLTLLNKIVLSGYGFEEAVAATKNA